MRRARRGCALALAAVFGSLGLFGIPNTPPVGALSPGSPNAELDRAHAQATIHWRAVAVWVAFGRAVQLAVVLAENQPRARVVRVNRPLRVEPPDERLVGRIPYDADRWWRVHWCEQPDTWHAGGHFGNGLISGGTGLGFSVDAVADAVRYAAQRGVILPASGWDMSIDQQMQMAQAMLDATGGGPDCL